MPRRTNVALINGISLEACAAGCAANMLSCTRGAPSSLMTRTQGSATRRSPGVFISRALNKRMLCDAPCWLRASTEPCHSLLPLLVGQPCSSTCMLCNFPQHSKQKAALHIQPGWYNDCVETGDVNPPPPQPVGIDTFLPLFCI